MGITMATPALAAQQRVHVLRRALVAVDLVMIVTALTAVLLSGIGASAPLLLDSPRQFIAVALLILWPIMLWETQTRAPSVLATGPEEYRRVLIASLWTLVFAAAGAYASGTSRARDMLLVAGVLGIVLLFAGRNVMRIWLHRRLRTTGALHRVFVVAPQSREPVISDQLGKSDGVYSQVGGWALDEDCDPDPAVVINQAVLAGADTVLYSPATHTDPDWPRRLGWAMEGTNLSLLVNPALADIAGPRLSIEPVQGLALVRVDMPRFSGPARVVKRTLDVVLSVTALTVMAIPMLVIALLIRRDSPGPVFFRQVRAGAGGSTFVVWKFRTMSMDADAQREDLRAESDTDGAAFKMEVDPRVTGTGRFLRRWSLDELPQFLNVLAGDMSLVGPRPHPMDDVVRYDDVATRRLLAKPGLTGLWQVSGRSDLDWKQAVMLDLYYVENWSLSLDLIILMRTAKTVLGGEGAY